ncbi:ABC transporter substrate-binding protein [Nitriliruptor alkaliphilus]|uniref:ABC transporter substrate-binding protein n=1 Tax=Nitriliruptor alkaliphilus TaxID=427918 RepID=UPI001B8005F5|nr:ABC transporter substrate-binding protein [Nitriliruptor alkaliphilus]
MVLTACGGGEETTAPDTPTDEPTAPEETGTDADDGQDTTELTDVSFSAVPSMTSIGLHVANDLGYFEEEGIRAEIVDFDSGAASEQAMLTGEVDYGAGGVVSTLLMEAAGEDVTNLVLFQSKPIFSFVVRSDLAGEIAGLEDLEGRTVGISSPGSLTDFFARLSLHEVGLDPDSDVDLVATGGTSGHVAALQAEQVDVQLTWEPGTTQITEVTGVGEMLVDLRTDEAPGVVGELIGSSLQALNSTIEEDPELAEAIVRAVVKADNAIAEDPSVLADALETHLFSDLPREQIERIAEIESASFRPSITEDEIQAWVDAYMELGFLEEPIEPSAVLDDRFADLWQ